jgi:hypothetical protein
MSGSRRIAVAVAVIALLAATAAALAAGSITKHNSRIAELAPGATRTLTAPYPDALEYGNARYYGTVGTGVAPGAHGSKPNLKRVKILEEHSVLGGSAFQVRAHNGSAAGMATVQFQVIATTVEPLPHH